MRRRLLPLLVLLAGLAGLTRAADARPLVVRVGAERVVVDRAPFRLTIADASGRTVLAEIGGRGRPHALAANDPGPLGYRGPPPIRYAALAYTVGTEALAQWHGSFYAGDLLFVRRRGTTYAGRRVLSVRRGRHGVRLVVATDEPRGRRLLVDLSPDVRGAVRVRVTPSSRKGIVSIGDAFESPAGEAFHGFGGRHRGVDQRGHVLYGWVSQENIGGAATLSHTTLLPALLAQGTDYSYDQLGRPSVSPKDLPGGAAHYLFPSGPDAAYDVQESFVSSREYAFLLSSPGLADWRLAADERHAWAVSVDGAALDYTVIPGRAPAALRTLTAITGRQRIPPAWAQGPILWRLVRADGTATAQSYRALIERDLAYISSHRTPLTGYAFEGWQLLDDPAFVRATIGRLHHLGIRAVLYLRAYVANDPLHTQAPGDLDYVEAHGLAATRADGRPYVYDASGSPAVLLDFTNATTRAWWKRRIALMLALGADGYMEDFGEQVLGGMHFRDGSTGTQMHNRYPLVYHRVTRALVDAYDRAHHRRTWSFTRSGFSGRPGSAAYEQGNFPGDETTDWSTASGLASLAPDMLNRAVAGQFGYSTDIGGYIDLFTPPPDAELFARWSEWSALTPFYRVHNSAYHDTRTPWSYPPATYRIWLAMARLHERALPLIRRLWARARRTGMPITRPLWLAAAGDRAAAGEAEEWMLGPDVLVAPVVERGARRWRVVLPPGCWRRAGHGAVLLGPGVRSVDGGLGQLPWFVRCGARPFGGR